ncbi:MAG: hypothetical protein ABIO76_11590 [Ginsengibacter sp.]
MKKLYFLQVVLSGALLILQSCSKQSATDLVAPAAPNVINATIAPNGNYEFAINSSGNVAIEKQASHYTISTTGVDAKTGNVVYQYVPAKDYTGIDQVVLSNKILVAASGGGCNNSNHADNSGLANYSITYTTIRLTIAK